jgi:hypothetical protein
MHPEMLLEAYGARTAGDDATPALDGNQIEALLEVEGDAVWSGAIRLLEGSAEAWALHVRVTPPAAIVELSGATWCTTSSLIPLLVARCFGLGLRRGSFTSDNVMPWSGVMSGSVPDAERTLLLEPTDQSPIACVQLASGGLLVGVAPIETDATVMFSRSPTEVWCQLNELLVVPLGVRLDDLPLLLPNGD